MLFKLNKFKVDSKFRDYFEERVKQVFLYVTDNCNLNCVHCYYKPWLRKRGDISKKIALILLAKFQEMGAIKLSLIGGEPTLYGYMNDYKPLLSLISGAKKLGYQYIRLGTNGQFNPRLLEKKNFKMLNELTFSIDGHTAEINDFLRGKDSFNLSLANLVRAKKLGYKIDITCCVHRKNIGKDKNGDFLIESMIRFAENLGINRINFHPLFKMGTPRDGWAWAGETDISPQEWLELYTKLRKKVNGGYYTIPIRIPQQFITKEEFAKNPTYYSFCPVKLGERVLVHSNGLIQICALRIGTSFAVARFNGYGITWNRDTNELDSLKLNEFRPCTNQERKLGDLIPLCISFKPKQKEIVWQEELQWEKQNTLF